MGSRHRRSLSSHWPSWPAWAWMSWPARTAAGRCATGSGPDSVPMAVFLLVCGCSVVVSSPDRDPRSGPGASSGRPLRWPSAWSCSASWCDGPDGGPRGESGSRRRPGSIRAGRAAVVLLVGSTAFLVALGAPWWSSNTTYLAPTPAEVALQKAVGILDRRIRDSVVLVAPGRWASSPRSTSSTGSTSSTPTTR